MAALNLTTWHPGPNGTVLRGLYVGTADTVDSATWTAIPGPVTGEGVLVIDTAVALRVALRRSLAEPVPTVPEGYSIPAGGSMEIFVGAGQVVYLRTA